MPEIDIERPSLENSSKILNGFILVDTSEIQVGGTVGSEHKIDSILINSEAVKLDAEGKFNEVVPLNLGSNQIRILARDSQGLVSERIIFVKRITSEKRLALVIGNSSYQHAAHLKNPVKDAYDIASTLVNLDFEVLQYTDLNHDEMLKAIRAFGNKMESADVALVFYAGHGMQVDNENFLLPIDAKCERKSDLDFEAVKVDLIMKIMESNSEDGLKMMILDACRSNPFKQWARGGEEGLARIEVPSGTLIVYSTSPDSYAADGTGDNGLYTGELIKQLNISQRIEDIFINTRLAVEKISNGEQSPWELARLRGKYYLK